MEQITFVILASFYIMALTFASPTGLDGTAKDNAVPAPKLNAAVNGDSLTYDDMVRAMGMQTANKAATDMEAMKMAELGMDFATAYFGMEPPEATKNMAAKIAELKQKHTELAVAPSRTG